MTIYIVEGSTGEYSDRTDWPAKAFVSKEKAEQFVHDCMTQAKEIEKACERHYYSDTIQIKKDAALLYDPKLQMDSTGTEYYIVECELVT